MIVPLLSSHFSDGALDTTREICVEGAQSKCSVYSFEKPVGTGV